MERLRILLNQMVSEKTADVFLNEIRNRPPVLLVKLVQERESLNSLLNQIGISPGLDRVGVITALEIWSKEYVKKEQGPLAIEKEEKQRSMAIIEKEEEQGPLAIEKEEEQGSMAIIEKEEEKSLGTDEKTIKQWTVDEVVQWALKIDGIEQEDTEALRTQRVSGKALLNLNAASLERCGILVGPASILAKEIENLKGPTQTAVDTIEKSLEILQLHVTGRKPFWPYEKSEMIKAQKDWKEYTSKLPWVGRETDEYEIKKLIVSNFNYQTTHKISLNSIQKIKQYIRHPIITGAPGTGKTTFGEHYPEMVSSCLNRKCSYSRACFSLVMTGPTPEDEERHPSVIIGLRLFWYFFLSHSMCWIPFQDYCRMCNIKEELFSIIGVVTFILSVTKVKAIVLHIDEVNSLMRYYPTKVEKVLQEIGRACFHFFEHDVFLAPIITGTGNREDLYNHYNYELSNFHGQFFFLSIPKKEVILKSIFVDHVVKGKSELITQNFKHCIESVVPLWRAVDLLLIHIGNYGKKLNEEDPFAGFMNICYHLDFTSLVQNVSKELYHCYGIEKWLKNGIGKIFLTLSLSGILFPIETNINGLTLSQLENEYGITIEYHENNMTKKRMASEKTRQESLTVVPQHRNRKPRAKGQGKGSNQRNFIPTFMNNNQLNLLLRVLMILPPRELPYIRTVCKLWNDLINAIGMDKNYQRHYKFASIELPYVLVFEVNSVSNLQVMNPQTHPWLTVQGFVRGTIFEDVDGISEELRSKAFRIVRKRELLLGEYYCGAFGREETLHTKIKLPAKEKFIKSIPQFCHPNKEKKIKSFDFKMKFLPCVDELGQLVNYAWLNGYVINTGPNAPTADIIRVYSKSSLIVMKQTKHMAIKETKSQNNFASYVIASIQKAYNTAFQTFSAIVDTLPELEKVRYRLIFLFVCNWPLDDMIRKEQLKIADLPPDTLLYHSENLKYFYSKLFLMRTQPTSISKEVTDLKYV